MLNREPLCSGRDQKGQSLLELVVGLSLITVVVGAIAIITTYSLRNTQFSKNQAQATKLAEENLEKVRAIRSGNYGVCLEGQPLTACSSWDSIWTETFGNGLRFTFVSPCTVGTSSKQLCLQYYNAQPNTHAPTSIPGFTGEITISDEVANQKRITSRIYWTDNSGDHSSDLVTVLSRY